MDNYTIDPESGCWIWQGYRDPSGYPYHIVKGRNISARRWHYEQRHGPVPEGLKLRPQCDNRLCVHPDHAKPVTPRTITRQVSFTKLDAASAQQIRDLAGQMPQRAIAEQFGISQSVVNKVLTGKIWVDEANPAPGVYEYRIGKLTFADAERIRELAQTLAKKDIAALYGVSPSTISLIVSGKRWARPLMSTGMLPEGAEESPEQ